jgi:carboxypeptidase C (cathepsin A)
MLDFFVKYPEYAQHDLWVTGESYAGVYVPFLAWRMDNYNEEHRAHGENVFTFNLKGIVVGNGVTNWKWDGDTTYVQMGFYNGLYGTQL